MELRSDFSVRVALRPGEQPFVPSPMPGVERMMLDRIGGEVARATSIVRYAAGSRFSAHGHDGGEEFLVLDGVFEDEHGAYGPGTYVRNPPGSSHSPASPLGCTIFVKLRQFRPGDGARIVVDTARASWRQDPASGRMSLELHRFGGERVAMERWPAGTVPAAHPHPGGEEILVLEGAYADEHGTWPAGSWVRSPPTSSHRPASRGGCTLLVRTGHLPPP